MSSDAIRRPGPGLVHQQVVLCHPTNRRTRRPLAGSRRAVRLMTAYLRARRLRGGCVAIVGWEGAEDDVKARRGRSLKLLRRVP